VNTNNPDVVKGITDSFMYWVAPPGREQDGVDGFRLDHMMDDLDSKHTNVQMLTRFWSPLEAAVRAKKPNTFFVAEQSDWGLGHDQFEKGAVDAVYAIPLRFVFLKALVSALKISPPYQPGDLAKAYREEQAATPPGKTQLVFVENHDLPRYASQVNNDPNLLRLGAVFLLTAKGTPSIYYGQELGMLGSQVKGHNDGNDIPVRLAMPWTDHHTDPGIAVWYVDGPWTTPGYSKDGDGISVESEDRDPNSLLNFYRLLIRIRKSSPALSEGSEEYSNVTDSLIDLIRESRRQRVRVLINLADRALEKSDPRAIRDVLTGERIDPRKVLAIAPHGFRLIEESLPTAAN
jgi:glycosidase